MKIKDRIKLIRKEKKITQVEFGEIIGVKGNTVTNYETGLRSPTDAVIKSICREFNVNETWLRTGEGDMFVEMDPEDELMQWAGTVLNSKSDSFKKRFVRMLSQMSDDEWEWVEEKLLQLFTKTRKEPEPIKSVPTKQSDLLAAHQRIDKKTTPEDLQHDLDIMMNDEEW